MGGGGTDGSLNADPQGSAGVELTSGCAVAADDGGHQDSPNNVVGGYQDDDPNAGGAQHFGVDHQARIDYGYNGIEKATTISKQIIAEYYGRAVDFLHYGLLERRPRWDGGLAIPELFDGVISQNPGHLPQAAVAEAWNEQALAPLATYRCQRPTLHPRHLPAAGPGSCLGSDLERLRRSRWLGRRHH